ncbi:hypothetical protein [Candidatus Uabimicrobium amorphum]|uniref:Uncharacterized protein n=1 Tax=Uabimicrobium amorphum TaxID=2596890 RepID=A0A5S9F496_UABAM|nr:hypothetical protein [Candidatus Uabimicrobium amorphum]BBM84244.1 hypothetical protein UABAM_02600 [Candidatus Uabimicrobium amorphum]
MNIHTYTALFAGAFLALGLLVGYMNAGIVPAEMKNIVKAMMVILVGIIIVLGKDFSS